MAKPRWIDIRLVTPLEDLQRHAIASKVGAGYVPNDFVAVFLRAKKPRWIVIQMREKALDLRRPHLARMPQPVPADERLNPVDASLLGS